MKYLTQNRFHRVGALLALLTLIAADARAQSRTEENKEYKDRYGKVAEHNIFLRSRPVRVVFQGDTPRGGNGSGNGGIRIQTPEQRTLLTGIIDQEGTFVATVEDISRGVISQLIVGDPVANGKIVSMTLDALKYESSNGTVTRVEIGKNLAGEVVSVVPAAASSSDFASAGPTTIPAEFAGKSLDDPSLTAEQKMKLRRMLELRR